MPKTLALSTNTQESEKPPITMLRYDVLQEVFRHCPPSAVGRMKATSKLMNYYAAKYYTSSWICRYFPAVTVEQLNGIGTTVLEHKETPVPLLPKSLKPMLEQFQHEDLAPLYQDIKEWTKSAQQDDRLTQFANGIANLTEGQLLVNIFLWIKTNNIDELKKEFEDELKRKTSDKKWSKSNVFWLLNMVDRNNLSAIDWAQINGNQFFLDAIFMSASRLLRLNAYLDDFVGNIDKIIVDAVYRTNYLQLLIRCCQSPKQYLEFYQSPISAEMMGRLNRLGENSIHMAARNVEPIWLETLLAELPMDPVQRSALLEHQCIKGFTPLEVAAQMGNWQAVALLLSYGAQPRSLNDMLHNALDLVQTGRTITRFHVATQCLTFEQVQKFIAAHPDFDLNTPDHNGKTLLHVACIRGDLRLANYLLDKGANYLQTDDQGWNALHFAIASHHIELIMRINSLVKSEKLTGIGHVVAEYGCHKTLKLFDKQVIRDLNIIDLHGNTPLLLAINKGRHRMVARILNLLSADTTLPAHLLLAAATQKTAYFSQLTSHITKVDSARDTLGNTALHLAVLAGNVSNAFSLLKAGADIKTQNAKGKSPNSYAKESKNEPLRCLFKLKTYGRGTGFFAKKISAVQLNAALALQEVLFKDADPAILKPYEELFDPQKGDKKLSHFYEVLLPLKSAHSPLHPELGMISLR